MKQDMVRLWRAFHLQEVGDLRELGWRSEHVVQSLDETRRLSSANALTFIQFGGAGPQGRRAYVLDLRALTTYIGKRHSCTCCNGVSPASPQSRQLELPIGKLQ